MSGKVDIMNIEKAVFGEMKRKREIDFRAFFKHPVLLLVFCILVVLATGSEKISAVLIWATAMISLLIVLAAIIRLR